MCYTERKRRQRLGQLKSVPAVGKAAAEQVYLTKECVTATERS